MRWIWRLRKLLAFSLEWVCFFQPLANTPIFVPELGERRATIIAAFCFMLRHSIYFAMLASAASVGFAADAPRIAEVIVEPAEVVLTDADQSVQFLVTLKMTDGTLRDGTRQAEYAIQLAEGSGAAESIA